MYSNRSVLQQMDVSESYRVFQQVLDKKAHFSCEIRIFRQIEGRFALHSKKVKFFRFLTSFRIFSVQNLLGHFRVRFRWFQPLRA